MTIRTETHLGAAPEHKFARPNCPNCDGVMLIAEVSEFDLKGRIRHSWSCDDCGHMFQTSIRLRCG
jgi:hypothetical protein